MDSAAELAQPGLSGWLALAVDASINNHVGGLFSQKLKNAEARVQNLQQEVTSLPVRHVAFPLYSKHC